MSCPIQCRKVSTLTAGVTTACSWLTRSASIKEDISFQNSSVGLGCQDGIKRKRGLFIGGKFLRGEEKKEEVDRP